VSFNPYTSPGFRSLLLFESCGEFDGDDLSDSGVRDTASPSCEGGLSLFWIASWVLGFDVVPRTVFECGGIAVEGERYEGNWG